MIFNAVVSNKSHPEYGVATIPFPIPSDQYDHTREREKLLTSAAEQIEYSVDDLEERVEQSNQWELEAADGQADSGPGWEMSP